MLFNSLAFSIFFPVVTIAYFLLPHRFRWMLLLAASCGFYMFFRPVYILILAFTIVIDYYVGIMIENELDEERRRRILNFSFIANLGVLAVFKYYNFFNNNITDIAASFGFRNHLPALNMLLPIGLSFHTFQAMSYTIEVYRGNQKAERHFGIYSLYVMFYPQLVAGPIERPQNILHQFHEKHKFNYDNAVWGLTLMAYGLFKKIVVADRLSDYVSQVFNSGQKASSATILLSCYFFAFQIYCDFSGYSDIARGAAKIMGFELMVNFNRPFLSKSISEFWQRWHISLSTWFYDYVFNPLVATMRSWRHWAIVFGLLITFFLSGFWHGADWKFIIWGLLYGVVLVYEFFTRNIRKKIFGVLPKWLANLISQLFVFHFFVVCSVFFRAKNTHHALELLKRLFEFKFSTNMTELSAGKGPFNLMLDFFVIGLLWLSYLLPADMKLKRNFLFISVVTILIIIFSPDTKADFIYFQF